MALHNGVDTVAVASFGVYSKTYGTADIDNIASLFVSFGYLEDAPELGGDHKGFLYRLGMHLTMA